MIYKTCETYEGAGRAHGSLCPPWFGQLEAGSLSKAPLLRALSLGGPDLMLMNQPPSQSSGGEEMR